MYERLAEAEDHIRNLVAIINALVPMDADCGLPSLLEDVEAWLGEENPQQNKLNGWGGH